VNYFEVKYRRSPGETERTRVSFNSGVKIRTGYSRIHASATCTFVAVSARNYHCLGSLMPVPASPWNFSYL